MTINLDKAKRYNRAAARTVGWIEQSAQVFVELGFVNLSPSETAFANAVEAWQGRNGLQPDGMLGPTTWQKMATKLKPAPVAAPAFPMVDWFKLAPKAAATRGKLLVSEGDVTAGANLVNDAYDLALYQMSDGSYELELFMKVQFFFVDGKGGEWTAVERSHFMRDWKTAVIGAWSTRNLYVTKAGKSVSLTIRLEMQDGGFMFDHWEIEVEKIAGSRQVSHVNRREKTASLDSGDLVYRLKTPHLGQVPAVHEFGHMLGNPDEYKNRSSFRNDQASLMHSGSEVRPRHLDGPRSWVAAKLKAYGIQ